ncbi:MAG: hypothetical protein M1163_05735 [Candidatus Thermoplasmatota archaeon]|nr:hypothetical protein [Candidatus Thermoplasmatota archaeon]
MSTLARSGISREPWREKADYGIFLTLEDPTDPMSKEAVVAGHIKTEGGTSIPKIQVLTIKELLEGKQPEFPFPPDNYNKAERGKRVSTNNSGEQRTLHDLAKGRNDE